jgi:hypothetical protein
VGCRERLDLSAVCREQVRRRIVVVILVGTASAVRLLANTGLHSVGVVRADDREA